MVDRWGYEGKLINEELDKRDLVEKRRKKDEKTLVEKGQAPSSTNSNTPWDYSTSVPTAVPSSTMDYILITSTTEVPPTSESTPRLTLPISSYVTPSSSIGWIVEAESSQASVTNIPVLDTTLSTYITTGSNGLRIVECLLPDIPDNAEARIASCS